MQRGLPSGLPPPSLLLRLSQLVSRYRFDVDSSLFFPLSLCPLPLPSSSPSASRATRRSRERETERERGRRTSSMDRSIDPTLFWRCSSPPPPLSPQFLSSLRTLLSSFVPLFRRHRDYSERGADSHGLLPILCKFICMIRQYFVSLFI